MSTRTEELIRRPRGRWFAVIVAAAVLASLGGYLVGSRVRSPADVVAGAKPPQDSLLTAEVGTGSIGASEEFAGGVQWRSTLPVSVESSVENAVKSVVTATPLQAGQKILPGSVVAEVSDRPVIALRGTVPMLRDLRLGDNGPDVARLQQGLQEAGYYAGTTDGVFDEQTLSALEALYDAIGYDLPAGASADGVAADQDSGAEQGYAATSEIVFVPRLPAQLLTYVVKVGGPAEGEIAKVGVGGLVVRMTVPVIWKAKLRSDDGKPVRVRLLDSQAKEYGGVAAQVGMPRVIEGQGAVVPITIRLAKSQVGALTEGTQVQVTLADPDAPSGLVVPLSALYSSADAGDFVRVSRDGGSSRVLVRVVATGQGSAVVRPTGSEKLVKGDKVIVGVDSPSR